MVGVSEFDLRVDVLERAVTRHPLHREVLYKTLCLCEERIALSALEAAMGSIPELTQATQSPYHLICVLVDAGGLDRTLVAPDGSVVAEEDLAELAEDEIDDLMLEESFQLTDCGAYVVELHAPQARIAELFEQHPERAESYVDLLELCSGKPRSYVELADLLRGRDALYSRRTGELMQPSVLIDDLNRASALMWTSGWETTEEGMRYLNQRS